MSGTWSATGQKAVEPRVDRSRRAVVGTRFGEAAALYDGVRPRYPDEVYDWILAGSQGDARVLDVGAGTGIFGETLRARGHAVTGVDPDAELLALHPPPTVVGTAEALPVAAESAELVTVAQAWHWIDPVVAAGEFHRVLTPGGRIAVIMNQLDVRVEWVLRLARIMHAGDVYRPAWRPVLEGFGPAATLEVGFAEDVTVDGVVNLAATRSYWLRSDARVRARVEGNIRDFLAGEALELMDSPAAEAGETGHFRLPYRCLAYCMGRTADV